MVAVARDPLGGRGGRGSWPIGTLVLLVVVAAVFVAREHLPIEAWFGPVRDWVGGFGVLGGLVLGVAISLATVVGVPGSLLAIAAGLVLGMGWGMLTAWLGITVGSGLCFVTAQRLFGARLAEFLERRPRVSAARAAVQERGWSVLLLLRLTPLVPLVVTNYLSGVSGVKFWRAMLATALGIVPAMLVYVGLGAAGVSEPRVSAPLIGLGVVATLVLGSIARRILADVLAGEASR